MNAKNALQEKLLGLGRGLTASHIQYSAWPCQDGGWVAKVSICGHWEFRSNDPAGRKGDAEKLAAGVALKSWKELAKAVGQPRKGRSSDVTEEILQERYALELEDLYRELGRSTYETHRLLRKIDELQLNLTQ